MLQQLSSFELKVKEVIGNTEIRESENSIVQHSQRFSTEPISQVVYTRFNHKKDTTVVDGILTLLSFRRA